MYQKKKKIDILTVTTFQSNYSFGNCVLYLRFATFVHIIDWFRYSDLIKYNVRIVLQWGVFQL